MSEKELNRVNVIQAVCEKRLRRRNAAAQLELTERQIQRLVNRYRESGAAGLAHGHRGKPCNHCLSLLNFMYWLWCISITLTSVRHWRLKNSGNGTILGFPLKRSASG